MSSFWASFFRPLLETSVDLLLVVLLVAGLFIWFGYLDRKHKW